MKQKRHTTEEIIRIIREATSDKDLEVVCRKHNISAASFYRWKKKFGGMELKDARKYRERERENGELKKMLADSLLKLRVLEEVNAKKGEPLAEAASGPGGGEGWTLLAAQGLSVPECPPLQPSSPTQAALRVAAATAPADREALPQVPTPGLSQAD